MQHLNKRLGVPILNVCDPILNHQYHDHYHRHHHPHHNHEHDLILELRKPSIASPGEIGELRLIVCILMVMMLGWDDDDYDFFADQIEYCDFVIILYL